MKDGSLRSLYSYAVRSQRQGDVLFDISADGKFGILSNRGVRISRVNLDEPEKRNFILNFDTPNKGDHRHINESYRANLIVFVSRMGIDLGARGSLSKSEFLVVPRW